MNSCAITTKTTPSTAPEKLKSTATLKEKEKIIEVPPAKIPNATEPNNNVPSTYESDSPRRE
jgi:hypothetical protein